jgi:hypothetical protein
MWERYSARGERNARLLITGGVAKHQREMADVHMPTSLPATRSASHVSRCKQATSCLIIPKIA